MRQRVTERNNRRKPSWWRDYYTVQEEVDGGFVPMRPHELLLPYWALRTGQLSPMGFRMYCAAMEVRARRRPSGRTKCRLNSLQEACKLVDENDGGKVKAAFAELKALGLVKWTRSSIEPASRVEETRLTGADDYHAMVERVGKCVYRKLAVPFPRRTLRAIAAGEFVCAGALAVIIGVSLRCLRRKSMNGRCVTVSGGLCSSAWIAEAFDVGHSTVKRWLSRLGEGSCRWLRRLETSQWVQQRWGARTVVNLAWGMEAVTRSMPVNQSKRANRPEQVRPRGVPAMAKVRPPYKNQDPSSKSTYNQDPSRAGLGFRRTAGQRSQSRNAQPGWAVQAEDLKDLPSLLRCYEQAKAHGLLEGVERPKVSFVAAATRAQAICTARGGDPVKLFASMVWRRQWHFLDWEHEKAAERRFHGGERKGCSSNAARRQASAGTPAARIVEAVMAELVPVRSAA